VRQLPHGLFVFLLLLVGPSSSVNTYDRSADRAQRVQGRVDVTFDQLAGSMVNFRRLLTALAGASASPQDAATEMSRYLQVQGPETYRQLADLGQHFVSRSMLIASAYGSECLHEMVPPHRMHEVGEPPGVPHPPGSADPSEWAAWYVLYGAWAAQQQAWSARVFQLIRDEIAAGLMSQEAVQASIQTFLRNRLPDYLGDMTEIGMDLFTDGLSAADESVRALSDALLREPPPATELTVEVSGHTGTIARTDLAIENNRNYQADVTCMVTPIDGIGLAVVPAAFHLAPGQTRRVSIRVALPDTPTNGSVPAGTISIAGYDDARLIVRVRATADATARQRLVIRTLDTDVRPAQVGDDAAGDRESP
jgi:hypothetical protein